MSAFSVPAATSLLSLLLAVTAAPAQTFPSTVPSSGMSKVRIVRLSEVRGNVYVDRGAGRGFEPGIENLPIVESTRVLTGVGVAEIEFEDNSTLRLAPDTLIDFPELERTAAGATVTAARVLAGTVYVSLLKTKGSSFTLMFGPQDNPQELTLQPGSHIRLQQSATRAELAVLGGTIQMNGADGPMTVSRRKTVSFNFASLGDPTVKDRVAEESFDSWDRQSAEYHAHVASFSDFGNAPYSYGLDDMAYYGNFMNMGGCGTMWRPYFASAAWNPWANGTWAWYSGAGYSWVSPYPWGWMPYHYGAWSYCPGTGWGWMPGGTWNALSNAPAVSTRHLGGVLPRMPQRPVLPPRRGRPTMVSVNLTPLVASQIDGRGAFVFRRDSAGLGIPREGLGGLRGFSRGALRRGTVSTPVYLTAGSGAGGMGSRGRTMAGGLAPVTIHRGFAPAPAMTSDAGFSARSAFSNETVSSPSPGMTAAAPTMSAAMPSAPAVGAPVAAGGGGGRPR